MFHRPLYELLADPRFTRAHVSELMAFYRLEEQDRKEREKKHKPSAAPASVKGRTARSR